MMKYGFGDLVSKRLFLLAIITASCLMLVDAGLAVPVDPVQGVALVIGNGAYEKASRLNNPVTDADDIGATLKKLGWEVQVSKDASLASMKSAVHEFASKLKGKKAGFFFYAGHGIQIDGINYLLPVDADIKSQEEAQRTSITMDFVLSAMVESRVPLKIVVLDSSRDNPFKIVKGTGTRGLAVQAELPSGTVLVYSTSPGGVSIDGTGRNGIFTQCFLPNLADPGLEFNEIFKRTYEKVKSVTSGNQMPWYTSNYYGKIYFAGTDAAGRGTMSVTASPLPAADTAVRMPPVLSVQDIKFSAPYLEGGVASQLTVTLKNVGPGEARDVSLEIEGTVAGVKFPSKVSVPAIPAMTGSKVVSIPLEGGLDLVDGEASFVIRVVEPNFKVKVTGKRVIVPTVAFKSPKLVVAKYAVVEVTSSSPNGQVDMNEVIDLRFALQNQGEGDARDVRIDVMNDQRGVMFLGIVEGTDVKRGNFGFPAIESGRYKDLTYRYFINSEFDAKELAFSIKAVEANGRFGTSVVRSVALNSQLREVGEIVRVSSAPAKVRSGVVVDDIPDYVPDVREGIPAGKIARPDAVAVVIGNKNYKAKGVPAVDYAANDADLMRQYLVKVLGYREGNVIFLNDATQADFNMVFGTAAEPKGKLFNYVKKDVSEVFIYYSGHGAPSPDGASAYFVPVDCDPAFVKLNGYSLDVLYGNLLKLPFKSLTVVIDSCFSGGFDKGMLLSGISGLTVVPRVAEAAKALARGNVAVFTSSSGSQVSTWYTEKQHSLFTYYFAKGLKELAPKGTVSAGQLKTYISENVEYMARRLNSREQTPSFTGDESLVLAATR